MKKIFYNTEDQSGNKQCTLFNENHSTCAAEPMQQAIDYRNPVEHDESSFAYSPVFQPQPGLTYEYFISNQCMMDCVTVLFCVLCLLS